MAREGIEKLLNITDRSYNVLYYIDFTYSTCALHISAVSTTCILSEFVEEKNRTCIFQQTGGTKKDVEFKTFNMISER